MVSNSPETISIFRADLKCFCLFSTQVYYFKWVYNTLYTMPISDLASVGTGPVMYTLPGRVYNIIILLTIYTLYVMRPFLCWSDAYLSDLSSGTTTDWTYEVAKVVQSHTYELRDTGTYGFLLPADQIIPNGEEYLAGLKAMKDYVMNNFKSSR